MEAFEIAGVYFRQAATLFRNHDHPFGEAHTWAALATMYRSLEKRKGEVVYADRVRVEASRAKDLFGKLGLKGEIEQLDSALR